MSALSWSCQFVLACLALCFLQPLEAAEQCRRREAVTSFGRWFTPSLVLEAKHWSTQVPHGLTGISPTSFRLLLAVKPETIDREWNIVVRDERMRVLASLDPADFADSDGRPALRRWTGRLQAKSIQVDLLAHRGSDAVVSIVEGLAYGDGSPEAQLFSIQGATPTWTPLYDIGDVGRKRAGDAVGMLLTGASSATGEEKASWCCSGVMLTSDLMLTNWHCGGNSAMPNSAYWNADVRDNTLVDLGWDDGVVRRQYNGVEVVAKDRDLDFALIRVRPVIGAGGGGVVAARISSKAATQDSSIFLVHHAQCKPKLVSQQCEVRASRFRGWMALPGTLSIGPGPDFTHDCDTESGSSGAPVFDAEGRLVGLHHLGFETDPACIPDHVNKAVHIADILDKLRQTHPTLVDGFDIERAGTLSR